MTASPKSVDSRHSRLSQSDQSWTDEETTFAEEKQTAEELHWRKRRLVIDLRADYLALVSPNQDVDVLNEQAQSEYEEYQQTGDDPYSNWTPAGFHGETLKLQQEALESGQGRIRQQDAEISLLRKKVDGDRESISELLDELENASSWIEGLGKGGEHQYNVIKRLRGALVKTRDEVRKLRAENVRLKGDIGRSETKVKIKVEEGERVALEDLFAAPRNEASEGPSSEQTTHRSLEKELALKKCANEQQQDVSVVQCPEVSPEENFAFEHLEAKQAEEIAANMEVDEFSEEDSTMEKTAVDETRNDTVALSVVEQLTDSEDERCSEGCKASAVEGLQGEQRKGASKKILAARTLVAEQLEEVAAVDCYIENSPETLAAKKTISIQSGESPKQNLALTETAAEHHETSSVDKNFAEQTEGLVFREPKEIACPAVAEPQVRMTIAHIRTSIPDRRNAPDPTASDYIVDEGLTSIQDAKLTVESTQATSDNVIFITTPKGDTIPKDDAHPMDNLDSREDPNWKEGPKVEDAEVTTNKRDTTIKDIIIELKPGAVESKSVESIDSTPQAGGAADF
ncbi:hypothetical protein FKW77_001097 [Venturia effusa]|uniref:Uncharacterized protein n=1 Tax=Venturia effusa TaxID=50376 RepID=A0A517LJK9_9PEZI|nr:hypothetical protein FKW77_001097 [Venturia effusa]